MGSGDLYMGHDIKKIATGLLRGFRKNWNPLVKNAFMEVEVDGRMLYVPIDIRQIRFVEKEFQVGDEVNLYNDGEWHFKSRTIEKHEHILVNAEKSIYL